MSNHTVKNISGDSYFILKLALLRTSAVPRRLGHVATTLIANIVFQARHIEIDVHFVRDQVLRGAFDVRYRGVRIT